MFSALSQLEANSGGTPISLPPVPYDATRAIQWRGEHDAVWSALRNRAVFSTTRPQLFDALAAPLFKMNASLSRHVDGTYP
jgi:hypothetical protein